METNIYASGNPTDTSDLTTFFKFAFSASILKMNTCLVCTIESVNGDGTYNIQQAVNSLGTTGQPLQSPMIYDVPAQTVTGGNYGIICPFAVGDLVFTGCCQRDSSAAVRNQGTANPSTYRQFNISDAIIIGKVSTSLPTTYIKIIENEVTILSDTVTVNANTVNLGNGASNKVLLEGVTMDVTIPGVASGSGVTTTMIVSSGGSSKVSAAP